MKKLGVLWIGVLLALLVGCGGGNKSSGSTTTPVAVSKLAFVELESSATSMSSAGGSVTLTARVLDASRNALSGQAVVFSTDSGMLVVGTGTSGADGTATATLSVGADRSNRSVTARASSGLLSASTQVAVTGSTLVLSGATSVQQGASASYTALLKDSGGNPIANTVLTVSSQALGNGLSAASVQTDYNGSAQFTYTATRSGSDTLRISGAGLRQDTVVNVTAQDFVFASPAANTVVNVGATQTVTVQYSGANPAGQSVGFSISRGSVSVGGNAVSSAVLDASGKASVDIGSTNAGAATLTATLGSQSVNLPVVFTATTAASVVAQANPTALAPNSAGSTTHQSTISAVVRDASNNVVANKVVNFALASGTGTLSSSSATTDANGLAQVQYISGTGVTALNGVTIVATVPDSTVSGAVALTVDGQALFLSFFTGNTMSSLDSNTYSLPLSVAVTDSSGVAVAGQRVDLSLWPNNFHKGSMSWNDTDSIWNVNYTVTGCVNEDVNRNGILNVGEDVDGNSILWPGTPALLTKNSATTDANGLVTFNVNFGKNYALWVDVNVIARVAVAGTESGRTLSFRLPMLEEDRTKETPAPAAVVSPFGVQPVCTFP